MTQLCPYPSRDSIKVRSLGAGLWLEYSSVVGLTNVDIRVSNIDVIAGFQSLQSLTAYQALGAVTKDKEPHSSPPHKSIEHQGIKTYKQRN